MNMATSLHEETQKSSLAFRTISEVSQEIDVPQHVLRFWESRFTQIRPLKRGGGRRYYRPEDIELLRQIKNYLYKQGYTIKGVQRLLKESRRGISNGASHTYSRDTDLEQDVRPEDFSKDFGESFHASTQAEEETTRVDGTMIERTLEVVETIHNEIENPPQPMRVDAVEVVEVADTVEEVASSAALATAEVAPVEAVVEASETIPETALSELREIHAELLSLRDLLRGQAA